IEVQEKNSAVGVIGVAGRSLRLEHWINGMQIFLSADRQRILEASSDEIALRIDRGVDPVVDQAPLPRDFNPHVMGGCARPDGSSAARILGLPDSKMVATQNAGTRTSGGHPVVHH